MLAHQPRDAVQLLVCLIAEICLEDTVERIPVESACDVEELVPLKIRAAKAVGRCNYENAGPSSLDEEPPRSMHRPPSITLAPEIFAWLLVRMPLQCTLLPRGLYLPVAARGFSSQYLRRSACVLCVTSAVNVLLQAMCRLSMSLPLFAGLRQCT